MRSAAGAPAIAAVLTCHNRRAQTLAALQALVVASRQAGAALSIVLVDDGSTDGTAAAVRAAFPDAAVIAADGSLFWCRGMHRGMQHALGLPVDFLLWLNDDTLLQPDALARLLAEERLLSARHGCPVIVAGATCDGEGRLSYGGDVMTSRWHRFALRRVGGTPQPQACDLMNGNCVLLPAAVARRLGNLDPAFEHAMGDSDYALRARRAGVPVYVASGFVGRCDPHPGAGGFDDTRLPLAVRWRVMMGRKGLPWRSWLHFTRRHGGWLWPLHFGWPYLRVLLSALARRR